MTPEEARLFGRTLAAIAHTLDALGDDERGWVGEVPVRRALEAFDAYPSVADFDAVSVDVEAVDADVRLAGGERWARTYWDLVALHFVARSLQAPRPVVLPRALLTLLLANLERVVESATNNAGPADPLTNSDFLLDLAISRGTAIPFEDFVAVLTSVEESVEGFPAGMWLHLHLRATEFGIEASDAGTPLLLEFFTANPAVQGWFGMGWILDPNLAEVSPHLSWYRDLLLEAGAQIIPIGSDDATVALATQTSETRRALFEGGQYRPRDYRVVMRRENVLQFYETTGRPRL